MKIKTQHLHHSMRICVPKQVRNCFHSDFTIIWFFKWPFQMLFRLHQKNSVWTTEYTAQFSNNLFQCTLHYCAFETLNIGCQQKHVNKNNFDAQLVRQYLQIEFNRKLWVFKINEYVHQLIAFENEINYW